MENNPWFILVLGLATVFAGLVCLIFIIKLMSAIVKGRGEKHVDSGGVSPAEVTPVFSTAVPAHSVANRGQFMAAVSAAIATYMDTDASGLRIHSLKCLSANDPNQRQQMIAAVAGAIAVDMGTDVSGLRIHSIKKI